MLRILLRVAELGILYGFSIESKGSLAFSASALLTCSHYMQHSLWEYVHWNFLGVGLT